MKRLNINESIWFIILISFAYYIYKLFENGKINIYIHPKMFKYVLFSLVVFITLSLFQIRKIFTFDKNKKIKWGYIIFIIPIFLGFVVNPNSLNTQIIENKGVHMGNNDVYSRKKLDINYDENLLHLAMNNDDINRYNDVEAQRFSDTVINAYTDLEAVIGEEVELIGFVHRQTYFSKNRFVVARALMNCCAADTQVFGLLCEWDKGSTIEDETWIKVHGILDSTMHYNADTEQEETMPFIKVTKVESVEEPENPYIYP